MVAQPWCNGRIGAF
ncbi:MAG: hypothetical protein KDE53_36250, partial [Caldilineaceae bacterium]|nr:hypothetical protein [Caldilineaceae bacterium]